MRNLKFKRYNIGQSFEPGVAEKDTLHLVPISINPLIVEVYDVDSFGNVAKVNSDDWQSNKELIINQIDSFKKQTERFEELIEIKYGKSDERPADLDITNIGYKYFDTDLNRYISWNGTNWITGEATETEYGIVKKMITQSESIASTVTELKNDFNMLLQKLKNSNMMS